MNEEIWREISGYPGYEVSNTGNVRSWRKGHGHEGRADKPRILTQTPRHRGRLYVSIFDGKNHINRTVHSLVLEAFIGPRPEGMEACHNNGNHIDNRPENLRWDTRKSNWEDRRKHGVATIGEKSGRHKLTDEEVIAVRVLVAKGFNPASIADIFNINRTTVCNIALGKSWKHIGGPITKSGRGSWEHGIYLRISS